MEELPLCLLLLISVGELRTDSLGEAEAGVILRPPNRLPLNTLLSRLECFFTGIGFTPSTLISGGTGVDGEFVMDDDEEEMVSFDPSLPVVSEGHFVSWGCVGIISRQSGEADLGIGSSVKYCPEERYSFSK